MRHARSKHYPWDAILLMRRYSESIVISPRPLKKVYMCVIKLPRIFNECKEQRIVKNNTFVEKPCFARCVGGRIHAMGPNLRPVTVVFSHCISNTSDHPK